MRVRLEERRPADPEAMSGGVLVDPHRAIDLAQLRPHLVADGGRPPGGAGGQGAADDDRAFAGVDPGAHRQGFDTFEGTEDADEVGDIGMHHETLGHGDEVTTSRRRQRRGSSGDAEVHPVAISEWGAGRNRLVDQRPGDAAEMAELAGEDRPLPPQLRVV